MNILGINAYHGDASACLVQDGKLIGACEEERFNRVKHCAGLPHLAAKYCLQEGGIDMSDVDYIAVSKNPWANFGNKLRYILSSALRDGALFKSRMSTVGRVRSIKQDLLDKLGHQGSCNAKVEHVEHHLAHMASAFFVSPFDQAALLSIDGFGDFVSTKIGIGKNKTIEALGQVCFPHSSGILYTATSQFIGFMKYGDEGKVMGLAPYGEPKYLEQFRKIVRFEDDFRFKLNLDYFHHHDGSLQMSWIEGSPTIGKIFSDKYSELFGPARQPGSDLTQHHMDIAASLQAMLEEIYFRIARHLRKSTGLANLCVAGGVALNSVCNGKLVEQKVFDDFYFQAAAGDGGTALGAAFYVWNHTLGGGRNFIMDNAYTGPQFSDEAIERALKNNNIDGKRLEDNDLFKQTAELIADGNIIGWFQGRTEFGPRALGHRSIVVDPRRHDMKDILNSRIKQRESFRPFAPSILEEHTGEFFECDYPSPFMMKVYPVRKDQRDKVPAITHIDGTGRLQTVNQKSNPRYYGLIKAFHKKSGVPLVLNTSFNENEPIVNTPEEAINCYEKTKMDVLALGNYLVVRK
jgi:carbamoyltransferase